MENGADLLLLFNTAVQPGLQPTIHLGPQLAEHDLVAVPLHPGPPLEVPAAVGVAVLFELPTRVRAAFGAAPVLYCSCLSRKPGGLRSLAFAMDVLMARAPEPRNLRNQSLP